MIVLKRRTARFMIVSAIVGALTAISACSETADVVEDDGRAWLAGDHHVHSEYSGGYDRSTDPPTFTDGGDGHHPMMTNVEKARQYGLTWMVTTDHGGPLHSTIHLERAYPDLLEARAAFPDMLVFYGMEFDTPAADHSTLIIPFADGEAEALYEIESRYSIYDAWPEDKSRNTPDKMIEALEWMAGMDPTPVIIKNHPGRQSHEVGHWVRDTPEELRAWNDTAPEVAFAFEAAPGHQAAALNPVQGPLNLRGAYFYYPTMGGFDQMTAIVGGVWDSLLGDGRRWWITVSSDFHKHYTEGNLDFWPGEYSKTYVKAHAEYGDILAQLRSGHMFVVTGDLISELDVTVQEQTSGLFGKKRSAPAVMGQTLQVAKAGADAVVTIRFKEPAEPNAGGERPSVRRVDLIMGEVTGPGDPASSENPTTEVIRRFYADEWEKDDQGVVTLTYTLKDVKHDGYIRIRGTNTDELEPEPDEPGENPWDDLWFYSNPVFIEVGE